MLKPVENVIRSKFIPALCENRPCGKFDRDLLSLPVKLGGLGIHDITVTSNIEFETSTNATQNITQKIIHQNDIKNHSIAKKEFQSKAMYFNELHQQLKTITNPQQVKANGIACSDGASIWLSTLPLKKEKFSLTKREFYDAINLRYGWQFKNLPNNCVCGKSFSVDHSMSCKVGGLIILRHNELVDVTTDLLSTVCKDVIKEPTLQSTPDSSNDLRADISVRGFWEKLQRAFLDVRVFYPFAPSYFNQSLGTSMKAMEKSKKRKYNQRVLDGENGTFTPLIFSSNGGMSKETKRFYSRLSELISEKQNVDYSTASSWFKRKLSFSLLRTTVICIRGSRSRKYNVPTADVVGDLEVANEICQI